MEQELLELSKDFKNRMKKKNIQIGKLKKLICILYGLCVITDEEEDMSLISTMRSKLSQALTEHMNIESDEEEEPIEIELEITNLA